MAWGGFRERSERLGETLEILTQAFADERIHFAGKHFTVRDFPVKPGPSRRPRPPIVVGGVGEKYTLPLVARSIGSARVGNECVSTFRSGGAAYRKKKKKK